ncbi:MAG TPA: hypothetical protein VF057_09190 [Thermoanaerobaculia bacterium]
MSGCDHKGPVEIMSLAETWLRDRGIYEEQWPGMTVRHAENTPGGMWASVVIDIERRGNQWIVTKLDRNREPLSEPEGLRVVSKSS